MSGSETLQLFKSEREKLLQSKNFKPLTEAVRALPRFSSDFSYSDWITCKADLTEELYQQIYETALALKPWRKGPFDLFGIRIDSEWRSNLKYNLIAEHLDIAGKVVLDVGCNNGYYMFRMLEKSPASITGFDPSVLCKCQFDFINHFIQSDIRYEMLGIEHIPEYTEKFDTIVCLGVIYHRTDPIVALKSLVKGLKPNGEIILDCLIMEGDEPVALVPDGRYARMPNAYYIPTIPALQNWLRRAGLGEMTFIAQMETTSEEQRKTDWIDGRSLEFFLDPDDPKKTVEGYPAPIRAYFKVKRQIPSQH